MKIPKPKFNLNINQINYGQMIENMVQGIKPILYNENINLSTSRDDDIYLHYSKVRDD